MILYPAIDLKDGKCIRLKKGELKDITFYNPDPIDQAESFISMGAEWIHNLPPILNRLKGKNGDHIEEIVIPYRLNEAYTWNGRALKRVPQLFTNAYFSFFQNTNSKVQLGMTI